MSFDKYGGELARYSEAFSNELDAFLDGAHYYLVMHGAMPLEEAVQAIREALDDAREVAEQRGGPALAEWYMAEFRKTAEVNNQVNRDFDLSVTSVRSAGFDPPPLDPFRHTIRAAAARYVATHEMEPPDALDGVASRFPFGPRLEVLKASPPKAPRPETARRIAESLTSPDNPDRFLYRLILPPRDDQPIPAALRDEVARQMHATESSAYRWLKASGFQLPKALRYRLRKPNRE